LDISVAFSFLNAPSFLKNLLQIQLFT